VDGLGIESPEIGIGAGTVTNIIANWTNEVGIPTAAALRIERRNSKGWYESSRVRKRTAYHKSFVQ
jgi:hypothetical protein